MAIKAGKPFRISPITPELFLLWLTTAQRPWVWKVSERRQLAMYRNGRAWGGRGRVNCYLDPRFHLDYHLFTNKSIILPFLWISMEIFWNWIHVDYFLMFFNSFIKTGLILVKQQIKLLNKKLFPSIFELSLYYDPGHNCISPVREEGPDKLTV